mgnify:CR=1 FL=1
MKKIINGLMSNLRKYLALGTSLKNNNKIENVCTLSELKKNTKTDREILIKVQNTLIDFFNGETIIDEKTRYELMDYMENYHRKYHNISMTSKALCIEDRSIQNKN